MLSVKNERSYPCILEGCGKAFKGRFQLKEHERTHSGEKPFACKYVGCDATFAHKCALVNHHRTHSGEKPYACKYVGCGATFAQIGHLACHIRIHTDEKPFACKYTGCGAAFVQMGTLVTHIRTHTGEKPYVCKYTGCDASFTTRCSLKVHNRTHTGEKPFACEYTGCGAAFITISNLVNHHRTHSGEKPYACKYTGCGATFTQGGQLANHTRSWHSKEGQARRKRQEESVRVFLRKQGWTFDSELHVDFRCMQDSPDNRCAYIDICIFVPRGGPDGRGGYVLLEIDEYQHKFGMYKISCDMERMARIAESLALGGNDLPILFLRYNPGTLERVGDKWIMQCRDFTVDKIDTSVSNAIRRAELAKFLREWEFPLTDQRLFIKYMYYDMEKGVPTVVSHPEYNVEIAKCVIS